MISEHDHRRRAWLATACALIVVAAFLAAKAARDAILLSEFPVTKLPLFVGLSAVLALPVIVVAGKLMTRHGPHKLVPAMNAVSAAIAAGEYFLFRVHPHHSAVFVFFHLNISSAVLVSGFWSLINERFDVTTAKRHIGRIGMGATLGGILGGVVAERTGAYFAPETILLVLAGMQGLSAILLWVLGHGAALKEITQVETSTWSALGSVAKSQLLRNAGLVVVATAVGAGALDYVFKADIVQGGSRADLLRALAVFYTVTNIITAIVQVVLCGPALSLLGVPRTVSTLPVAVTGFSVLALFMRIPMVATIARGAELVTRNSLYRAGYELLYAPLPPEQKRPTKIVLDVGADKLGDIISAQLVGAVLWIAVDDRTGLLILASIAGAISLAISLGIPRSYRRSLEAGLMEKANELPEAVEGNLHEPWVSLTAMPAFGHPGDAVPLRMRRRRRPPPAPKVSTDTAVDIIRQLRSNQPAKIIAVLAQPLPAEALPAAIELVGAENDTIAVAATNALRAVAPRCTGALIDVLLDPQRPERLRRRMPAIIAAGQPELAVWGLWRGLRDTSFEVRCRSSIGLAMLAGDGPLTSVTTEEVFEHVRRELHVDREEWKARTLAVDAVIDAGDAELDVGLAHIFRVLGLALPAEPLRVALRAAKTDDPALRGMALEYLESILPPDVRAQLWPLLDEVAHEAQEAVERPLPSEERQKDVLERLRTTYPALFARKAPA
jgi:hypothetical protein